MFIYSLTVPESSLTGAQNAGHIVQNIRGPSFHALTDTSSYHVLAIDYRGFGHSSGTPDEAGLIDDASAAVDFCLETLGISPERIVLLGQSLGTAVVSGVAERYASRGVDFGGVILVAGFSGLPNMLGQYAIGGLIPILKPLTYIPGFFEGLIGLLADTWLSDERLQKMVREVKARGGRLRLSLVAAHDDRDIPHTESNKLFAAAVNGTFPVDGGLSAEALQKEKTTRTLVKGKDAFVAEWKEGNIIIRQEQFPYGGKFHIILQGIRMLILSRTQRHHDECACDLGRDAVL
jgi:abhydrolase domain-containing protein 12